MTKSNDARQDLIGGFRPHEGPWVLVGMGNRGSDGRLERLRTAVHPASQLFFR